MKRSTFTWKGAARHLIISILLLAFLMFSGCSTENPVQIQHDSFQAKDEPVRIDGSIGSDFKLEAKYSYIRSYPGGGGIYIIRLSPEFDFTGEVELTVESDPVLNAVLSKQSMNAESPIAEITIRPERSVDMGTYFIDVTARQIGTARRESDCRDQTLRLEADLWPWGDPNPQAALDRCGPLMKWAQEKCPEFDGIFNQNWYSYLTYPGILVVEHWTFMSRDWEVRFCFHVMIPPYDWTKIMIRQRGEWEPEIAGKREYDGVDYRLSEIPISEYPTFYGY